MLPNKQTVAEFLKKFQRIPKPSKFSSLKKSWSRRLRSFETRFFFLFLSFFICIFLFYFLLHRAMCHLSDLSCGGPTMYVKGKNSVMHQTVERSSSSFLFGRGAAGIAGQTKYFGPCKMCVSTSVET